MIQDIIRKHVEAMGLSFGHGPRTYEDLQEGRFPLVWLYPYIIQDEITNGGAIFHTYNIVFDCHRVASLDDSEAHHEQILRETADDSKELLIRLSKDPAVDWIRNVRREPMYNVLASNLSGHGCAMDIRLKFEPFKYCYPPTP